MIEARVEHVASPTSKILNLIFAGSGQTFDLAAGDVFARSLMPLPDVCNDMMRIACAVFHADGSVSRGGDTRPDLGESWRRDFRARIKVSRPDIWSRRDVSSALREAAEFLTEDRFQFDFEELPEGRAVQQYFNFGEDDDSSSFNEIILFSGGLDSFAGALQALAGGNGNVVLLTHRSAQKAITRQTLLADYLKERFPRRVLHVQITARRKATKAIERTQRSRSLLFASLAYAVARALRIPTISFYENGVISQNLPISGSVIGTMATRTTHPYGLVLLERLLASLGDERVAIRNPFAWMTKTEVLEVIRKFGAEDQIRNTVSCTSLHTQSTEISHCGSCTQCLDRRFAVYAAGMEGFEQDVHYRTDVFVGARDSEKSRQVAIEWTRHARSMERVSPDDLLSRFGHEVARLLRGHPGLPKADTLVRIADLQARHAKAALRAIERALCIHGPAMARGEVPGSALISTLSEDSGGEHQLPESVSRMPRDPESHTAMERTSPAFGFPLQVSFSQLGEVGSPVDVVDVKGLGSVTGLPASVAHGLKTIFDEDQAEGLPIESCRYVTAKLIPMKSNIKAAAVTKNIQRCRDQLSEYYVAVEGSEPAEPLLIQSSGPKGYRLDPTIRIVKP